MVLGRASKHLKSHLLSCLLSSFLGLLLDMLLSVKQGVREKRVSQALPFGFFLKLEKCLWERQGNVLDFTPDTFCHCHLVALLTLCFVYEELRTIQGRNREMD